MKKLFLTMFTLLALAGMFTVAVPATSYALTDAQQKAIDESQCTESDSATCVPNTSDPAAAEDPATA